MNINLHEGDKEKEINNKFLEIVHEIYKEIWGETFEQHILKVKVIIKNQHCRLCNINYQIQRTKGI